MSCPKVLTGIIILFLYLVTWSLPPAGPLVEYGPAKMSMAAYFEQSGQDIFKPGQAAVSSHYQIGGLLSYSPFKFLQFFSFFGASQFDHNASELYPGIGFNGEFDLNYGGGLRLNSPRVAAEVIGISLFGGAGLWQAEDSDTKHVREGKEYQAGGQLTFMAGKHLLIGLGGEFYLLDGSQKSPNSPQKSSFANQDLGRGLITLEYYPTTTEGALKGRPFINIHAKITPNVGYDEHLGLKNAAIGISVGLISDFLYGPYKALADESE